MNKIMLWFSSCRRKAEAKRNGVEFRFKKWYNLRAMLPKDELVKHSFIEIFDKDGRYIDCPSIGGEVILNHHGERYKYKVVGFQNQDRDSDWLYETDYINPVIEYLGRYEEA